MGIHKYISIYNTLSSVVFAIVPIHSRIQKIFPLGRGGGLRDNFGGLGGPPPQHNLELRMR